MENHKKAISLATVAAVLLLSTVKTGALGSPAGESHDTPDSQEVNINSSFLEVMDDHVLSLNSTEEPPTTYKPITTTTTVRTTPEPKNIVTVHSVPFVEGKPLENKQKIPVKAEESDPLPTDQTASVNPEPPTPAKQSFANDLSALVSTASRPRPKPLESPVEKTIASLSQVQNGTLVEKQQSLAASDGSPIELSSTSFTSNEAANDATLDPIVASLLKDVQRHTRNPGETKLPSTTVKKDEALSPSSNVVPVLPVPVLTPHVLHVDPQSGQVFLQQFAPPQAFQQIPQVPKKPSPNDTQPPNGSGRWLWNLFGWNKKPTPEPTQPSIQDNAGIHIIKAKKNVKPGEPYYECPLVKASPSPPPKQQRQRSFLFFL